MESFKLYFDKNQNVISALFFLTMFIVLSLLLYLNSEQRKLNSLCQSFGAEYLVEYNFKESENNKISFFYSKLLDTCIMKQEAELENTFTLGDIQRRFIKDWGSASNIFFCEDKNLFNILLYEVEELDGYIFNEPYSLYQDYGESLKGFRVKSQDDKYSRSDCKKALRIKEKEVR